MRRREFISDASHDWCMTCGQPEYACECGGRFKSARAAIEAHVEKTPRQVVYEIALRAALSAACDEIEQHNANYDHRTAPHTLRRWRAMAAAGAAAWGSQGGEHTENASPNPSTEP
jgi:hypothetical protein